MQNTFYLKVVFLPVTYFLITEKVEDEQKQVLVSDHPLPEIHPKITLHSKLNTSVPNMLQSSQRLQNLDILVNAYFRFVTFLNFL